MTEFEKEKKADRKIFKIAIPIVIVLVSVIIIDRMTGFLTPQATKEQCGIVYTGINSSAQFQGDKTFGLVVMQGGRKSFVIQDYVVQGDTICKANKERIKKDGFIQEQMFIPNSI